MTPLEFIASLPHGETKAAALTVRNLMTLEADRMTTHLDSLASAFGAEIDAHLARPKSVKSQHDPIKHPNHYTSHPSGIEPIEICAYETFYRGNVIKYVMRAPYKGCELQDLKKARQYLDWEISRVAELDA